MVEKSNGRVVEIPCFGVFENRKSDKPVFVSAGLDSELCFHNALSYLKAHYQIHKTRQAIVRRARAVAEFGREVVGMN